jgi:Domain of unknown function (DUF4124)
MTAAEMRLAISACVLVGVLAHGEPGAAQIYKWVDGSGTVHFSDTPPKPGAGAVEVLPEGQPRAAAPPPRADSAAPENENAAPDDEGLDDSESEGAAAPFEDSGPTEIIEDGPTEIIVEGAPLDPAVRYRANSPRNRPEQPIRQPQPLPRPRRAR